MSFFLQYKDLLRLLSGHVIAQIIALLFSPILTRIYNPTDYALLGIMLASSNVLFEFYTLKYDRTIVISSKKIISINLLFLCLIISFLMTLITLVINYYLIDYNALYKLHPQISILKYILPIITFFMAIVTSYYFWFQRISKYDSIAVNKIFQITIISLLSLLLGIFNIQNGLVVGYFIGWLFTFIFGIIQLLRSEFDWNFFSFSIIRESIIKYKHYPIYNTIPSFLNVLAQSSPFLLITYYYGNEYGGYFNICKQIIQIPFSFVSMSISQVYFKKLVDSINNHQRIFPLLIHVSKFLFFLIGIAMFVIFIGGEKLFGLIFGKNWEYVGVLSKYYIFSVIMFSIHQSFSIIYPSLHLVKQESIIKFLYFIIVFFVLYFHPSNFLTFMLIYTIAECVVFIIGICVILIHVHKYEKSIS